MIKHLLARTNNLAMLKYGKKQKNAKIWKLRKKNIVFDDILESNLIISLFDKKKIKK